MKTQNTTHKKKKKRFDMVRTASGAQVPVSRPVRLSEFVLLRVLGQGASVRPSVHAHAHMRACVRAYGPAYVRACGAYASACMCACVRTGMRWWEGW